MLNVMKIEGVRGGWFYVIKGSGANSVLVKIRTDGRDARVLCHALKDVVRFEGNYIYYRNAYDDLRVVRIDGADDRFIAEEVDKIFPAEDGLYYCRNEFVKGRQKNLSLYHMDRNGRNIKKIVFNLDRVLNDDETNKIYYSKAENMRYKMYKPGKEKKAMYTFLNITKYYSFTKAEAGKPATEPELLLTLGLPEQEKKKGCLAKFKKDFIYEEAPIIHSYKNRGLSDEEIMAEENDGIAVVETKNMPAWAKKFVPQNAKGAGNKKAPKGPIGTILGIIFGIIGALFAITFGIIFGILGIKKKK